MIRDNDVRRYFAGFISILNIIMMTIQSGPLFYSCNPPLSAIKIGRAKRATYIGCFSVIQAFLIASTLSLHWHNFFFLFILLNRAYRARFAIFIRR